MNNPEKCEWVEGSYCDKPATYVVRWRQGGEKVRMMCLPHANTLRIAARHLEIPALMSPRRRLTGMKIK